jgi:aminoglycoside/choline kinase family phosphotransferase
MVDIQDARWGPDAYDLASLLRDAYVDIQEDWVEPLIRHYLDQLDDAPSYDEFRQRFDIVAAQRMLKALGTFGYQIAVLGNRRYESAISRTTARLRRLLTQRHETRFVHEKLAAAGLFGKPD